MVFTDLDMPKLDGFGLLSRIRGSDERAHQGAAGGGDLGRRGARASSSARASSARTTSSPSRPTRRRCCRASTTCCAWCRTSKELEATREAVRHHRDARPAHRHAHAALPGDRRPQALRARAPPRRRALGHGAAPGHLRRHRARRRARTSPDVVVTRIAKLAHGEGAHRGLGGAHGARDAFMVVAAGTAAPQMLARRAAPAARAATRRR